MIDKLNFLIALAQEQHFGRAAEAFMPSGPRPFSRHFL
jgi:DNA-binding transcriptional LysR family regulator